jgi:transposase
VLVFDGVGMWLCTRRLQSGGFSCPHEDSGSVALTREQLDWLVADLPWQRLSAPPGHAITAV